MKIALVSIAYNQPESIERLFAGASRIQHRLRFHLFLHSQHAPTMAACERIATDPRVQYHAHGKNHGVSRSWNEGMLEAYAEGADVVIIANDDIEIDSRNVDRLAAKAAGCRDRYIVTCAGWHHRLNRRLPSHGYACFAINPIALDSIGCFDENFFPAYCEDQDYARRAALAGLVEENCADTDVRHLGSAAIFAEPSLRRQNAITHGRNSAYYRRKWGGDAGQERFTCPFDDGRFDHCIAPARRHAPYGSGLDRTDHEIVRM